MDTIILRSKYSTDIVGLIQDVHHDEQTEDIRNIKLFLDGIYSEVLSYSQRMNTLEAFSHQKELPFSFPTSGNTGDLFSLSIDAENNVIGIWESPSSVLSKFNIVNGINNSKFYLSLNNGEIHWVPASESIAPDIAKIPVADHSTAAIISRQIESRTSDFKLVLVRQDFDTGDDKIELLDSRALSQIMFKTEDNQLPSNNSVIVNVLKDGIVSPVSKSLASVLRNEILGPVTDDSDYIFKVVNGELRPTEFSFENTVYSDVVLSGNTGKYVFPKVTSSGVSHVTNDILPEVFSSAQMTSADNGKLLEITVQNSKPVVNLITKEYVDDIHIHSEAVQASSVLYKKLLIRDSKIDFSRSLARNFSTIPTPVTIIIKVNDVEINRILFSPSNDLDNYGLLNNTTIPAEVSAGSLLTLETNNDINNIIISLFVTSK